MQREKNLAIMEFVKLVCLKFRIRPSISFNMETSLLIFIINQMSGFYKKTALVWDELTESSNTVLDRHYV